MHARAAWPHKGYEQNCQVVVHVVLEQLWRKRQVEFFLTVLRLSDACCYSTAGAPQNLLDPTICAEALHTQLQTFFCWQVTTLQCVLTLCSYMIACIGWGQVVDDCSHQWGTAGDSLLQGDAPALLFRLQAAGAMLG